MIDSREAAFIRAIAEEGKDNSSRLVFADWLEEHDEAPRAEFIRVQCELARLPGDTPRASELRRQERAFVDVIAQMRIQVCVLVQVLRPRSLKRRTWWAVGPAKPDRGVSATTDMRKGPRSGDGSVDRRSDRRFGGS